MRTRQEGKVEAREMELTPKVEARRENLNTSLRWRHTESRVGKKSKYKGSAI